MILIKWKDHKSKDDSAEFASMRKAQKFISEYICTQPVILNSIRVVDNGTEYYFKYKFDKSPLLIKKQVLLLWQDCEGNNESVPFKTLGQANEFVEKYLLNKPVIWSSIRIIESIVDFRINGELSQIS